MKCPNRRVSLEEKLLGLQVAGVQQANISSRGQSQNWGRAKEKTQNTTIPREFQGKEREIKKKNGRLKGRENRPTNGTKNWPTGFVLTIGVRSELSWGSICDTNGFRGQITKFGVMGTGEMSMESWTPVLFSCGLVFGIGSSETLAWTRTCTSQRVWAPLLWPRE